jgi:hypothetical protein
MSSQTKSLHEITQQAIQVLSKEIGIASTVRFLNQFSTGYGDYTEERHQWLDNVTMDEILADIKKHQETI